MDNSSLIPVINNKIGAILAQLNKNEDGEDSVRSVDFIVDMFDRNNADSLGEYWDLVGGNGASIRNGVCIPASIDSNLFTTRHHSVSALARIDLQSSSYGINSYSSSVNVGNLSVARSLVDNQYAGITANQIVRFVGSVLQLTSTANDIKVKHKARINNNNYHIKMVLQIDTSAQNQTFKFDTTNGTNPNLVDWVGFSGGGMFYSKFNDFFYAHLFSGYVRQEITFPSSSGNISGSVTWTRSASGESVNLSPHATASLEGQTLKQDIVSKSELVSSTFNLSSVDSLPFEFQEKIVRNTDSAISPITNVPLSSGATVSFQMSPKDAQISNPLLNNLSESTVIEYSIIDETITARINGVIVHQVSSSEIAERGGVGMYFKSVNMAAIFANFGYLSGISSIKAWADGTVEPPDESGFGTYDSDAGAGLRFKYEDKYHQRLTETSLNERGFQKVIVVGYSYNPNA